MLLNKVKFRANTTFLPLCHPNYKKMSNYFFWGRKTEGRDFNFVVDFMNRTAKKKGPLFFSTALELDFLKCFFF